MAFAARACVVLLCVALACGGGKGPGGDPGSVSVGNGEDGGTQVPDGGSPSPDGGPAPDAGPSSFRLTVLPGGRGSGRVTSSPAGIDCGATCAALFDPGANVTLTAAPQPGSTFGGWGGPCSGTGACVLAVGADTTISATFQAETPAQRFTVTVSVDGGGAGRVTSTPAGIDCPTLCAATFAENSRVSLAAAPSGGSSFVSWGGACSGAGECIVTAAASVIATFAPPRISIEVAPTMVSLGASTRQQFSATVTGSADTGVLWSVQEGAPGGTVDGAGLYLAPPNAGVYHVVATSHADPTRSAAATVTVTGALANLPPRLSMASFDASLAVGELSLDATGSGSSRIGRISLHGSEGTVEIDGRSLSSIAYERQQFATHQTNLYQVISVAPDRFYLMWIYCRATSPDIYQLWIESTAGEGLAPESGSGSCNDTPGPSNPRLRAPAVSMEWPKPVRGFSASGTGLDLPNGAPGTVLYESETQVAFSFTSVDCSFCGTPGWYELHSLLWNPSTHAVTLGIFYLMIGGEFVLFEHSLSMPVLTRGFNVGYKATWSRDSSSRSLQALTAVTMPWLSAPRPVPRPGQVVAPR